MSFKQKAESRMKKDHSRQNNPNILSQDFLSVNTHANMQSTEVDQYSNLSHAVMSSFKEEDTNQGRNKNGTTDM